MKELNNFLNCKNVVGSGLGHKIKGKRKTSKKCIQFFVRKKLPLEKLKESDKIPKEINGIPTDVIEIGGECKALAVGKNIKKMRPVICGISGGHINTSAGTIGLPVCKEGIFIGNKEISFFGRPIQWLKNTFPGLVTKKYFWLTNNHVAAQENEGKIGDFFIQPGIYDGGKEPIGKLFKFIPLKNDETVDVALVEPLKSEFFKNEVLDIGIPLGIREVEVGELVQKSGRTSGYTKGTILSVGATIKVSFSKLGSIYLRNCILTTVMTKSGDSVSHDTKILFQMDDKLYFDTIENVYNLFKTNKNIQVLSVNKRNRKSIDLQYTNTQTEFTSIGDIIFHGIKPVYKVTLSDGKSIKVTEDHSLMGTYVGSKQLNEVTIKNADKIASIRTTDFLGESTGFKNEILLLAGLWIGDGSYDGPKIRRDTLAISTGHEENIVKFLTDSFRFKHKSKGDYRLNDRTLTKFFINEFGDVDCYNKRIPNKILFAPLSELALFLKGYFSADGSFHKKENTSIIEVASVNYKLLEDTQFALSRFGIHGNIDTGYIPTAFSDRRQYKLRIDNGSDMRIFLEKIGFLKKIKELELPKNKPNYGHVSIKNIRKIEYIGEEPVYDFKIPNTEMFVGNGILCHNSGSALFDMDNNVVGIICAGNDTISIACNIQDVFDKLGVSLVTEDESQ